MATDKEVAESFAAWLHGHLGRRISDFWAGLNRNWSETQGWKRLRKTVHDHNPVNDAMGNVEAFEEILRMAKDS